MKRYQLKKLAKVLINIILLILIIAFLIHVIWAMHQMKFEQAMFAAAILIIVIAIAYGFWSAI